MTSTHPDPLILDSLPTHGGAYGHAPVLWPRPGAFARYVVPPVRLALGPDGQPGLAWSRTPSTTTASPDASGFLREFLELGNGESEVAGLAARWGPLWLCAEHGLYRWHDPAMECRIRDLGDSEFWEPLAPWFELMATARAVASIAADLYADVLPQAKQWEPLGGWLEEQTWAVSGISSGDRRDMSWGMLGAIVGKLAARAGLFPRPAIRPDSHIRPSRGESTPAEASGGSPLVWQLGFIHPLALLALQLGDLVTGISRPYRCDGCGAVFVVEAGERHRAPGRLVFCPRCREGGRASKRLAARRRRAAQRTSAS